MKQSIKERVHALRMTFHPNSIKAFIIPSTDPHLSEYVAPHWMSREWISGFTGSLPYIKRCCRRLPVLQNFSANT